jgi:hypothetical protein
MIKTIEKVFSSVFEGLKNMQMYNDEKFIQEYLDKSVDEADLECRMKNLKSKNYL